MTKIPLITVTMKPMDLKTHDELLADHFLWGWIDPTIKFRSRKYLKKGDELEARQALIRVLRSDQPLNPILRKHLAELFEVNSAATRRQLVFKPRQTRKRSDPMRAQDISNFVNRARKELPGQRNVDAAVEAAKEHFQLSRKTIYKQKQRVAPKAPRKG
jgi:hypothetical protein